LKVALVFEELVRRRELGRHLLQSQLWRFAVPPDAAIVIGPHTVAVYQELEASKPDLPRAAGAKQNGRLARHAD
jgi:hypothetical protein